MFVDGMGTAAATSGILTQLQGRIFGLLYLSDHPLSWNVEHTSPPGGLAKYYETNVIGGPGAVVMVAQNFNSFGQAIIKKMIAEVAQAHAPMWAAAR